ASRSGGVLNDARVSRYGTSGRTGVRPNARGSRSAEAGHGAAELVAGGGEAAGLGLGDPEVIERRMITPRELRRDPLGDREHVLDPREGADDVADHAHVRLAHGLRVADPDGAGRDVLAAEVREAAGDARREPGHDVVLVDVAKQAI